VYMLKLSHSWRQITPQIGRTPRTSSRLAGKEQFGGSVRRDGSVGAGVWCAHVPAGDLKSVDDVNGRSRVYEAM